MASGSAVPGTLNGILAKAGLDVLVAERYRKKNEPEGNAYHYVFQQLNNGNYLMTGPFRKETVVPHWFEAEHLERYWTGPKEETCQDPLV